MDENTKRNRTDILLVCSRGIRTLLFEDYHTGNTVTFRIRASWRTAGGPLLLPEGEFVPRHTTYYSWIGWVVRGQFSLHSYNSKRSATAGCSMVGGPGETVSARCDLDQSEVYVLLMDGLDCSRLLKETKLWPATFPYKSDPARWLEIIAERISVPAEQSRAASCGHSLFVTLRNDVEQLTSDPLILSICQYIQENWNNPSLNVESILDRFSVARSTLAPRFRGITGMSILNYLMDIRGRHVEQMLSDTRATVQQVAYETGFSDPSYFTTWFRKRMGCSPLQFRRRHNPNWPDVL